VEIALELRDRHPPSRADLDRGAEPARSAQPIERVGVEADPARGLGHGDRVGAATVAIAGLIVMSLGSTPWVLAVGDIIWLAAEAVTLAGFFWSWHELPEPRPGYWSMRFMLIHDTVRAQSSAQRS